jgi:Reverse transcriptase (RNA-dependent DNA polymerase)
MEICSQLIDWIEGTIYAAALVISKAYDRISHVRLFTSLLRTGMPRWVVYLLVDWYNKLQVAVRWMDSLSAYFKVGSGLRQGSSLSPALFNVYINVVIIYVYNACWL